MTTRRPVLLITGATGVLGHPLVEELAKDHEIVSLRRQRSTGDPRITEIAGDLTHDELGLSRRELSMLAARVVVVVHSAAVTNWSLSPPEIRATNVGGSRRMLRFAEQAGAPLYYVSTAFVGRPLPEHDGRFAGLRAYVESKIETEELVRASGQPTVIVRPSVVIGDSRSGRISAFQGIYQAIGAIVRGLALIIPAEADALVDVIPQDVLAQGVAALVRRRDTGGEHWITSGPQTLTIEEMVNVCLAVGHRAGRAPSRPRLLPKETVDRLLLPLMEDVISRSLRRRFEELIALMLLFQSRQALPTSLPELGCGPDITKAALTSAFERSVEHWAVARGMLPAVTAPVPAGT